MKTYHVLGVITINGIDYTVTCIPQEAFDTLNIAKAYAQYWSQTKNDSKIKVVIQRYSEKTNSFREVIRL